MLEISDEEIVIFFRGKICNSFLFVTTFGLLVGNGVATGKGGGALPRIKGR